VSDLIAEPGAGEIKMTDNEITKTKQRNLWTPEVNAKRRQAVIESYKNPEVREKHRQAMLRRYSNSEERERTRQQMLERYKDPNERLRTGKSSNKYWTSQEAREHQRQEMKRVWSDPEYKSRVVRNTVKANQKSPNIPETIILDVLDTFFPNEWIFVGNNEEYEMHGKLPDFLHKENKWVIEHFGDYHHSNDNHNIKHHQTYKGTMAFYYDWGYKPLIIWEHDVKKLSHIEIAKKISEYFNTPLLSA
jgi:hypothetical protein